MFFKERNKFDYDEMVSMENELRDSVLWKQNLNADKEKLSEQLKLKVEYVDDMDEENEAELLPIDGEKFLGLIRLRKELERNKFAYSHEIIHYIFDVGYGNRVEECYARKRKGKTKDAKEQIINYKTAAYIMPFEEIRQELGKYDNSRPKMDEIKFIGDLRRKYGQSETAVIRRIREVRCLAKGGYCP